MGFQLKTTLLKYQTGISMETSFKFDTEYIENDCIYVHKFDTEYRKWILKQGFVWNWSFQPTGVRVASCLNELI